MNARIKRLDAADTRAQQRFCAAHCNGSPRLVVFRAARDADATRAALRSAIDAELADASGEYFDWLGGILKARKPGGVTAQVEAEAEALHAQLVEKIEAKRVAAIEEHERRMGEFDEIVAESAARLKEVRA